MYFARVYACGGLFMCVSMCAQVVRTGTCIRASFATSVNQTFSRSADLRASSCSSHAAVQCMYPPPHNFQQICKRVRRVAIANEIVWYPRMLIARTEPAPGRVCVCVCVRVCVRACVHTHDDTQATNIHGSMELCACTQGHPDIDRHSQTDTHTQTHATNKSNYQIMHGKIVPGEKGDVAEKPLTQSCLNGL